MLDELYFDAWGDDPELGDWKAVRVNPATGKRTEWVVELDTATEQRLDKRCVYECDTKGKRVVAVGDVIASLNG
jgi:hypothetical protein